MVPMLSKRIAGRRRAAPGGAIDEEARRVGELQRSLLPHPLPQIPGLEMAASYRPCGWAGGDLYDVFPLDDANPPRRWCVFMGDASGHGLAAAVVAAMVQSILRAHPDNITGVADLLTHVNRHLCRKRISGFVTAFLAIYEPSSRRLTYACAGHPPPLLRSATDGAVSRLDAVASCPLGIDVEASFAEAAIYLRRRDSVLLYTDGITEIRDFDNNHFSEERLQLAFGRCGERAAGVISHVEELVAAHGRGGSPSDDQTLLAIVGV